ncbi:hypothetical protein AAFP35_25795 [Gordonia sp. CPCC 206044]|uniref:hypothetical protein n=1 Tax=Gordonia sp. CPCC 206044 TaxID=3140793 RepID=UPI003AF40481
MDRIAFRRREMVTSASIVALMFVFMLSAPGQISAAPAAAAEQVCGVVANRSLSVAELKNNGCPPQMSTRSDGETPLGYTLEGEKSSNLNYQTPKKYFTWYNPVSGEVFCEVTVVLNQWVDGSPTRYWEIESDIRPSPERGCADPSYNPEYDHYCGVNMRNARDITCAEYWLRYRPGRAPDVDGEGPLDVPTDEYIHYFGEGVNVTKFPMMRIGILFASNNGTLYLEHKYRLYDVCPRTANTLLCTTTGRGDD